jgi:ribosomal-protein-alanine N-acetyltransferase
MALSLIVISAMSLDDLDAVIEILRNSHLTPWPPHVFTEELAREWAYVDVIHAQAEVVGFCNYWLVRDEVHLLNIAVLPTRRRQGLARRLMDQLMDFARRHECTTIILEVRKSNQAAIELYNAYGFAAVGLRPRYYVEDREDALVMSLSLATSD